MKWKKYIEKTSTWEKKSIFEKYVCTVLSSYAQKMLLRGSQTSPMSKICLLCIGIRLICSQLHFYRDSLRTVNVSLNILKVGEVPVLRPPSLQHSVEDL